MARPHTVRPDGAIEIPLTKGYVAIVDAQDIGQAAFNWYANVTPNSVYAQRWGRLDGKPATLLLHREIMGLGPGRDPVVDHEDGDGLNCRRGNMRVVPYAVNLQNRRMSRRNTTGYNGVQGKGRRFVATIGKRRIGTFDTAEAAHAARVEAELEAWGVHPMRAAALSK